jgi:hypothetical protein
MNDTRSEDKQSCSPAGPRTFIEQYEEAGFVVTTISQRDVSPTRSSLTKGNGGSHQLSERNKQKIRLLLGPSSKAAEAR